MKNLNQIPGENLGYMEEVEVVDELFAGRRGKVFHAAHVGKCTYLYLRTDKGDISVNIKDVRKLNGKLIETLDCKLMIDESEHAEWDRRCDELHRWAKGDPDIVSF